jgi:GT2 family glycosyltransferase
MSNKSLSIIIVNYKSEPFLKKCIASIYGNITLGERSEIIVVNNDSQEKLESTSLLYPGVKIINTQSNRGFGSGGNLGAKNSSGETLLFLNPDAEIISKNTEDVLALFSKDPVLGILGSRLVAENEKVQKWSAGSEVNLWNLIKNNLNLLDAKKVWMSNVPLLVNWVSGTAFFIKRELFEEVEGFDENFFMYFEDVDLCKKVRKKGKKVLYYPDFSVKHMGGKCYLEKDRQKKDYYRSQEYYFKKHRNFIEWQLVKMFQWMFF